MWNGVQIIATLLRIHQKGKVEALLTHQNGQQNVFFAFIRNICWVPMVSHHSRLWRYIGEQERQRFWFHKSYILTMENKHWTIILNHISYRSKFSDKK